MNLTELSDELKGALGTLDQFIRILRDYDRAHKLLDRVGVLREDHTGVLSLSSRVTDLGLWAQTAAGRIPIASLSDREGLRVSTGPLEEPMAMSKSQAKHLLAYLNSGSAGTYDPVKRDEALAILRRIAESETPE